MYLRDVGAGTDTIHKLRQSKHMRFARHKQPFMELLAYSFRGLRFRWTACHNAGEDWNNPFARRKHQRFYPAWRTAENFGAGTLEGCPETRLNRMDYGDATGTQNTHNLSQCGLRLRDVM